MRDFNSYMRVVFNLQYTPVIFFNVTIPKKSPSCLMEPLIPFFNAGSCFPVHTEMLWPAVRLCFIQTILAMRYESMSLRCKQDNIRMNNKKHDIFSLVHQICFTDRVNNYYLDTSKCLSKKFYFPIPFCCNHVSFLEDIIILLKNWKIYIRNTTEFHRSIIRGYHITD